MAGTKHEADNGEVELDFGETEGAEVEIDAPEDNKEEPVVVETVEKEAAPEDNKAEQEEYSASVKKRIDRLTKKCGKPNAVSRKQFVMLKLFKVKCNQPKTVCKP